MAGGQILKHGFLILPLHTNLEFLLEQEYRVIQECIFLVLKYF